MKIDFEDFKDVNGDFYKGKSDTFIHFFLFELAGKEHIAKYNEPVYYYNVSASDSTRIPMKYNDEKIKSNIAIYLLTPYLNLDSLDDEPRKAEDYNFPTSTIEMYE